MDHTKVRDRRQNSLITTAREIYGQSNSTRDFASVAKCWLSTTLFPVNVRQRLSNPPSRASTAGHPTAAELSFLRRHGRGSPSDRRRKSSCSISVERSQSTKYASRLTGATILNTSTVDVDAILGAVDDSVSGGLGALNQGHQPSILTQDERHCLLDVDYEHERMLQGTRSNRRGRPGSISRAPHARRSSYPSTVMGNETSFGPGAQVDEQSRSTPPLPDKRQGFCAVSATSR